MSDIDRKLDIKICRIMGWTYSRGWAFEKTGDKLNVTGQLRKTREAIKMKLCMKCQKQIGDKEWNTVDTLIRFGQVLFWHVDCEYSK